MDANLDRPEQGLGPDPNHVHDVLVLRPGGLGQVVKSVPALRHLRGVYPNARVSVVAGDATHELLQGCPYVDRCVDERRPSEAIVERYDVAISLAAPGLVGPGRGRLNKPLALDAVNSGVRVAYRAADEEASLPVHPAWPTRLPDAHRMLRLVWLLGGERAVPDFGLWPTLADRNGAAALVGDVRGPIALVHPGAGTDERRWDIAGYARVIDTIAAIGVHPVVIGTVADRRLADALGARTTRPWTDIVGRTGVGVLAGMMERAAMFVGNDSGPASLALALGVHSVVIGPASAIEQSGAASRVMYVTAGPCTNCGEHVCDHPLAIAPNVPTERVLSEVSLAAMRAVHRFRSERL